MHQKLSGHFKWFLVLLNFLKNAVLFIIKWRYLIALIIFILCVVFKIHGSSINEYNRLFSDYDKYESQSVILGGSRSIRSDEWIGQTPYFMSQYYNNYAKDNDLISLDGHDMILGHNSPVVDVSMIAKPFTWGYMILGNEYGLAWYWASKILLFMLITFEACMIISRKNKKVALLGAIMVTFSPAVQWWFVGAVEIFIWGLAMFVAAYYFFVSKKWQRWLFMIFLPVSAIAYVLSFYPPLQISVGLVMLALFVACLVRDKKDITFKKKDIWRIVAMALFALGVLVWIIWESKDAIMMLYNTVYPGKRVSLGGGQGINGLFTDLTSFLLPFRNITYSNNSEVSTFIQFAPIVLMLYPVILKKMKHNKNMIVGNTLLVCIIIMFIFMSIGFPELLAKLTLFSYIDSVRMKWAYGFVAVLFTIWGLDMIWQKQIFSRKQIFGAIVAFGFLYICFVGSNELSYASWKYYIVLIGALVVLAYLMLKRYQIMFLIGTTVIMLVAGATVNPIAKGTMPLFGHPLEQKINEIAVEDKDAHWLALNSIMLQQIGIANGARMLNALNFYPDYAKWEIIDPDGKYEDFYNRYAHIRVVLTDGATEFILPAPDTFTVRLSCEDVLKWPTKYLLSEGRVGACADDFVEIYADTEGEYYIYERITK